MLNVKLFRAEIDLGGNRGFYIVLLNKHLLL